MDHYDNSSIEKEKLFSGMVELYGKLAPSLTEDEKQTVLRRFFFLKFNGCEKLSDMERWCMDGLKHNWKMPPTVKWKRFPIVRHIRFVYHSIRFMNHQSLWSSFGRFSTGYDEWVLYGMLHGMERRPEKMLLDD